LFVYRVGNFAASKSKKSRVCHSSGVVSETWSTAAAAAAVVSDDAQLER